MGKTIDKTQKIDILTLPKKHFYKWGSMDSTGSRQESWQAEYVAYLVNIRCKFSSAKSLVEKVKTAFAGLAFSPAIA